MEAGETGKRASKGLVGREERLAEASEGNPTVPQTFGSSKSTVPPVFEQTPKVAADPRIFF
jgi:hypothetical protein